ncbi:MAG: hypothetical protein JNK14_10685 [Chitinophagaceae bacterium]|nr:hypothetical protein [Chitinophagaceae bacterium]
MLLLSITDLIARFHPVLVHLPIGILLLACLFQWLTIKNRYLFLQPVIPAILFWGMIGAVASCISGYLLSQSGEYDAQLVTRHQWLGILVAAFSFILYVLYKLSLNESWARWLSVILVILVTVTGHLGGTLTHGEGYLTSVLNRDEKKQTAFKPIPDIEEAAVYADIVQPVLEAKCYSCHSAVKQKGKLRLDSPESMMKGGESGKVLIPGKADESELVKRIFLPLGDEDHMPPKAKPQLTENEVLLLHWWVSTGAGFDKKVKELTRTEKIKPVLLSLQSGEGSEKAATDVPGTPVDEGDLTVINKLRQAGVMIIPVAQNSHYLSANFVTAGSVSDSVLQWLVSLKKQLIWLKLDNTSLSDSSMNYVAACMALTRLQLSHTPITDKGLVKLQSLMQLRSLNVVGTKVTIKGILALQKLAGLKSLYVYQTGVNSSDWDELRRALPAAQIDTGKYTVPALPTDTAVIRF